MSGSVDSIIHPNAIYYQQYSTGFESTYNRTTSALLAFLDEHISRIHKQVASVLRIRGSYLACSDDVDFLGYVFLFFYEFVGRNNDFIELNYFLRSVIICLAIYRGHE